MALWRNIQRLAGVGAVQGVVEPGPTDVLTPAQAVQVIDDVSHAVQPLAVPVSFYQVTSPAVALRFAAFRVNAGPRGTLVRLGIGQNAAGTAISNLDTMAVDTQALANLTTVVPTVTFGGTAPLSTVQVGDATLAGTGPFWRLTQVGTSLDVYIAPGEVFQLTEKATVAAARNLGLIVQDVP